MKKKLTITLASFASLTAGIMTPLLSSCSTEAKLQITMEGSKWGYIISEVKPYYEYTLTLSDGFKDGDLLEMEIINPSLSNKIKLDDESIKIDGDDVNSINVKIIPYSFDPSQEQFSVTFNLKLIVKRENKEIYSTQIDSLILDAVIPATDPSYYTYTDASKTTLTGVNEDKYDELIKKGCLVIPNTVETIAGNAFAINESTSPKIKEIYKSNRWLLLDYSVYDDTKPCSLKTIGTRAFYKNEYFRESLYIPSTVETIGEAAFRECSGFREIKFASKSQMKTISNDAFCNCFSVSEPFELPKNTTLTTLPQGLLVSNTDRCIPCESIKIPNNIINTVEHASFFGLNNLKIIDLSDFDKIPTWQFDPFYNPVKPLPTQGTIYVNNENLIEQWKKIFQKSTLINWNYVVKK